MKTSYQFRITSNMCGTMYNVKPEGILDMFQTAAGLNANLLKVGMKDVKEKGMAYVVHKIKFEMIKPIKHETVCKLTTWPNPKDRLELRRQFDIENEDEELCVIGSSSWLLMDIEARKLRRTDDFEYQTDEICDDQYFKDLDRIRIDGDFKTLGYYEINVDDLDTLGHLNNSKYFKMLYMFYPNLVKEAEIDYLKETKLGTKLEIKELIEDDYHYIKGESNDGVHFMMKIRMW